MQKGFWLTLLGMAYGSISAMTAQKSVEKEYLMSSHTTQFGWSTLDLTDAYLSDLPYSGYGLQYSTTTRRFLYPRNQRISMRSDVAMYTGVAMNAPQTASISYVGGNVGYGLQAHFKPIRNVQFLLGAEGDAEMGVKVYSREVNNAFNMDLAMNLNLAATLRYDLNVSRKRIRLQADLRSPFLGLMFVPERGESYSEIVYLGSSTNLFHLTSLHNKNGLNIRYLVQVPVKFAVLNIGFQTDYLKYAANDMVFKRNITSMQIGASFDLIQFGGRKNPAPTQFISSEW